MILRLYSYIYLKYWKYRIGLARRKSSSPNASAAGRPGVEDAERQFIEANLWAVVATAKRYRNRGVGMLDLIQEGNIGLMTAAKTFDYARGYRSSTYSIWWVRQMIQRLILGRC